MSFAALNLNAAILKAVEASGYTDPTPVQLQAIPAAIAGRDLLVSSHTGSGKTAAFLLPSLHRIAEPSSQPGFGPRLLVLTPTRELALQVQKAADVYGKGLKRLRTVCLVGGVPYPKQIQQLRNHVDIIVATPGRLLDHIERGRIDFNRLETLVLDEADRMLDMGFIDDIEAIVANLPATRQTLLFSATLEGIVGDLARRLTRDPQRIEIEATTERQANIEQKLLLVDNQEHKTKLLNALLECDTVQQAVIFTATKRSADELAGNLRDQGYTAAALHGDMRQNERNRTLQRLREGRTQLLVATDVAARGIDVAGISHVINYDPPRQAEDYVHRIGRTGRAGRSGIAFTLINHRERRLIRDIENYTGQPVQVHTIPGLEPKARTERPFGGRPGGHHRPGQAPRGNKPGGYRGSDKPGNFAPRKDRDGKPTGLRQGPKRDGGHKHAGGGQRARNSFGNKG